MTKKTIQALKNALTALADSNDGAEHEELYITIQEALDDELGADWLSKVTS